MFDIYYMFPKHSPNLVHSVSQESTAKFLVETCNKIYQDGREYWYEEEGGEVICSFNRRKDDALELALFDRTEARSINKGALK